MNSTRAHSPLSDWLALARLSNLPTVVSDSLVGVALAVGLGWSPDAMSVTDAIETTFAMCCFYVAGMVLNGIVDREIDARERPTRPIASGRIALPWAWTAFVVLLYIGFVSRPSWSSAPIPAAVAGVIGVWLLARASAMRSHMLHRLAKGWCAVALIAALWWAIDVMVRDPFDLSGIKENTTHTIRSGHIALNAPVLLIAISLVAYNLLHTRTAWAIAFLAICRASVPLAVAAAILVPGGKSGLLESADVLIVVLPLALHTIMLSIVARREMSSEGATYRCARCGYVLVAAAPTTCSECGCDLNEVPALGDRPLAPRTAWKISLISCIALVPLVALFVPLSLRATYGFSIVSPGGVLSQAALNYPLFVILAVWFALAASRGLRAALTHPSRRPAGIAALIAAFALLDACIAALLLSHSPAQLARCNLLRIPFHARDAAV